MHIGHLSPCVMDYSILCGWKALEHYPAMLLSDSEGRFTPERVRSGRPIHSVGCHGNVQKVRQAWCNLLALIAHKYAASRQVSLGTK